MRTPENIEQWCEYLYQVSTDFVRQVSQANSTADGAAKLKIGKEAPYAKTFYNAKIPAVKTLKSVLVGLGTEYESLGSGAKFKETNTAKRFENLAPEMQCEVLIAATAAAQANERLLRKAGMRNAPEAKQKEQKLIRFFVPAATTPKQPWNESMLALLLKAMRGPLFMNVARAIQLMEKHKAMNGWCEELESLRQPLVEHWFGDGSDSNWNHLSPKLLRLQDRLDKLPSAENEELVAVHDAWTRKLSQVVNRCNKTHHPKWTQLLELCETCKSPKPSKKFLNLVSERVDAIGEDSFCKSMIQVFGSVGGKFSRAVPRGSGDYSPAEETLIHSDTGNCLRCLVWSCSLVEDPKLYAALAEMAGRCFEKVRGVGPRSPKTGNACLWVFSESKNLEIVAELSNLLPRVKHVSTRKQIEKAAHAAAEKLGMTRDDLDDQAIPSYGLTEIGFGSESFGEFVAESSIKSCRQIQTIWKTPTGKTQKTVPKAVKDDFAKQLKEHKARVKKLRQTLAAQRDRIESFFMADRSWDFPNWKERYANHPVVGWFSRHLVWEIQSSKSRSVGIWQGDRFVDEAGKKIRTSLKSMIRIWHPISDIDNPELITQWRKYILENEITQPFKQAHREVYVLTDAEKKTKTYSNRFSSHIVKQGQFQALCKARQWQSVLMDAHDSVCLPGKVLRRFNLRVEFIMNLVSDDIDSGFFYTYLGTDQLRFYECPKDEHDSSIWQRNDQKSIPLTQVPEVVFSEIMRDCDLFVGVASVGNNPNWQDGGPDGNFRDYWHEFSFGELQDTAKTRREILKSLVPHLEIADRCTFDDRFLIVRGDLRTYKIHLGSSNVLMEPNGQYLCIVPKPNRKADELYLPFEGDQRLSIIISKAIMLADDKKIKDASITSQIKRK